VPEQGKGRFPHLGVDEVGHAADEKDDARFPRFTLDHLGMTVKERLLRQLGDVAFPPHEGEGETEPQT